MIGRLHGSVASVDGNQLIVDVSGVGYEVEVSGQVLAFSGPNGGACQVGAELLLSTHMVVREDAQLLYGFVDQAERDLFRAFIRINGVGPKMALALISNINAAALAAAVQDNNIGVLTQVPGVGKKTAERLMVELKSRLNDLLPHAWVEAVSAPSRKISRANAQEAEEALQALGYKANQASEAVAAAYEMLSNEQQGQDVSTEQLVSWVLRKFARGS